MGKEKKDAPTRLERLFGLLESGSTDAVRKAAAEQIAEVVKLHPHELNQLLFKVGLFAIPKFEANHPLT